MPLGKVDATSFLKGTSQATQAATRACSALTEASDGKPITSPAANTWRTLVRNCASTSRRPRSFTARPIASRPSPSTQARRPAATSTASTASVAPEVSASRIGPRAGARHAFTRSFQWKRTPNRSISDCRRRENSASRNDSSASRPSTTCTSQPSALNVDAYSLPITPAPITARRRGSFSSSRIRSESHTRG